MSHFRFNKLVDKWVLFAPHRAKRPIQTSSTLSNDQNLECPFDVGNEHYTPNEVARIGDEKSWRCRVIPNLYNALDINQPIRSVKNGSFEEKNGFGAHEVIIESSHHEKTMFDFDAKEFFDYFSIIQMRLKDLKKDIRLKYFSLFKNHGIDAGASQSHSHSQIIAMPFIPPKIKEQLDRFENHKKATERDFIDDLIYDEKNFEDGVLFENEYFIALCPYASQYSFEVNIFAKQEHPSILDMDDEILFGLSKISNMVFTSLKKALGEIPFNMFIENGAMQEINNPNRFHIRITPRLYKTAGFELDSDIFINSILPEEATKILKGEK